ncbi:MAG: aminotransferase class V-fold PLP-dependent enzyme [Candidatus Wallbacteria bacterium]|nr:aminotransferase class V-fold PLP-dependent enzyme [Candidatus Wallbacteria bacterium]
MSGVAAADFVAARALFPATRRLAYLMNAAVSPIPTPVLEAIGRHLEEVSLEGCPDWNRWLAVIQRCKNRLARLLGVDAADLAFTKNTSQGLQLAAASIPWRPGDNIVSNDMEFPANVFPWKMLEPTRGVQVRTVASAGGRVTADALVEAMDGRTRAVAVSWVQFSNGFRCDLERLSEACERRGCWLVVDGVQGVGALELDVRRLGGRTMVAGGCHKWLLCPPGLGYFHCPRSHYGELSPAGWGWLSMRDPFRMGHEPRLRDDGGRFEEGNANVAAIHGLDAALELLERLGMSRVEARVLELAGRAMEEARKLGCEVLTPCGPAERSGIVLVRHPAIGAGELVSGLARRGVMVVERDGAVRVSPHFYNDESDIERFAAGLREMGAR